MTHVESRASCSSTGPGPLASKWTYLLVGMLGIASVAQAVDYPQWRNDGSGSAPDSGVELLEYCRSWAVKELHRWWGVCEWVTRQV